MSKEKQLTIALLKEKLERISGKKVTLKETEVLKNNDFQDVYDIFCSIGGGIQDVYLIVKARNPKDAKMIASGLIKKHIAANFDDTLSVKLYITTLINKAKKQGDSPEEYITNTVEAKDPIAFVNKLPYNKGFIYSVGT